MRQAASRARQPMQARRPRFEVDAGTVRLDYLAVHGYKWLLCPRGAYFNNDHDGSATLRALDDGHW